MGISNLKQEKKKENRHQILHIVHNFIFNNFDFLQQIY